MNDKTGGNVFMKQETIRKLLSLIIAVCMLFGMLPTPVFAVDGTITGTMDIGGETGLDLGSSSDKLSSSGWAWDTITATLTLDSSYSGANKISINCGSTATVNLVYSGDISIDASGVSAVFCAGNLNVSGTGGALTLTSDSDPLCAAGDLQITGGTVIATTTEDYSKGIISVRGNISISGAAAVTASGTGTGDCFGIMAQSGDLTISTTGTVTATGNQYAIAAMTTTVNSGIVKLNGSRPKPDGSNTFIFNGGTVIYNNGTPPLITDISPNSSPASGGTSVTITGSGFAAGATVKIGGIAATDITVTGTTQITCILPSGSAGNATVLVETSGGATALTDGFIYTPGVSSFFDTGTATFDLANLPIGNANGGSGDTAWTWSSSDQLLTFTGAGPYTLTGTASGNIRMMSDIAVTLTLNGAHFTRNDSYFALYMQRGGTLKVTADSSLTSTGSTVIGSDGSLAIELENNAVLQTNTTGTYSNGISAISGLTLTGSGRVEATSSEFIAVSCVGDLAVEAGCTLSASGKCGLQFQDDFSGDPPIISGGGKITAIGDTYYGISGNPISSSLTFDFDGILEIAGATYGIDMMKTDAPTAVIFANAPGSLTINSQDGIIGSSKSGTVTLQNTANIPGLTEVFQAGGTTFSYAAGTTFTVILNASGGTALTPGTLTTGADGKLASLPTPTRSDYNFDGWFTAASGGTQVTTSTVFTQNTTIYAHWTYTGGNGPSSPGSGSSPEGPATPATPASAAPAATPGQPVTAIASVTATAGTNGATSAAIPEQAVTDAIAKAQADAKAQGKTANGISVAVNVTMPQGATSLTAALTRNSLNSLVSAGVTGLEINGSPVTVTLDQKALAEIQKQSSGDINISIAPNASLSSSARAMIGTRPVYNITVGYGSGKTVSGFGGGTAAISIPYTPAKGEAVGALYAVYVDDNGNATRIPGSAYDANTGSMIFTTTHFSLYGIGYTAPSAKFSDISTHWGKDSIDYVIGRGLLSGTVETTFAPNAAMTREMLVTALGRLAGADAKAYTTNSFTDVTPGSASQPFIEWAYKKGIIKGIGNSQFAPDRAITREEIAVIFSNYAKATDYTLTVTREETVYADADRIGSSYQTAVKAMQQAGIMTGGSGNKFNPKSSATRAEVSSMLHRYIKLTIDPATAQGWALNDAGQYLYYKNGKALTGTQTIGGTKYFFNTDGTLKTGWVKDDAGNWYFYDRNVRLTDWRDIGENGSSTRYYFTGDGIMAAGKWLEIDGRWYCFYADGSLAVSTTIDGYEVDENGVRKSK